MGDISAIPMEEILRVLQQLQEETTNLRSAFDQLQTAQNPVLVPPATATSSQQTPKEPRIVLPEKFDETRSKFRDFVNHIRLIFCLQAQRYPTAEIQIGLIGGLLTRAAFSWFLPLLEKNSPLLTDLDAFLVEFTNAFGETDRAHTTTTKLRSLQQRPRAASVYVAKFRQLACDVDWDDNALISAFRWGLRDDVKDLLLNLPDPTSLSEAITQAVRCDNRLFERRQERRSISGPYRADAVMPTKSSTTTTSMPEPMQINASRIKKLTLEEKERRRREDLYMYCGGKEHRAHNCPAKVASPKPYKF